VVTGGFVVENVKLGNLEVSRFILGANPFCGFSHHSIEKDWEMRKYFTVDRIKQLLRQAESLGVNSLIARVDFHIMRMLLEYYGEGGKIQWIAQVCSDVAGNIKSGIEAAINYGAKACFIHGGHMDYMVSQSKADIVGPVLQIAKDKGIPVGVAGHNPEVFKWASENLKLDFYMCSHYDPIPREDNPQHRFGAKEEFKEEQRQAMAKVIKGLPAPVIHYKILAGGRNDPREAYEFTAGIMRPGDAVCVGIYPPDKPDMMKENIELLESSLKKQL